MENQRVLEYKTIRAAVTGEKWTAEKVVDCYRDEIGRLSAVAVRQPDGSTKQKIDKDIHQSTTKRLTGTLPQSSFEEIEKGNVEQAKKEQGTEASI